METRPAIIGDRFGANGGRRGMKREAGMLPERTTGPISKVVGLYQTLLRRSLEHFFPDAVLEAEGDRSFIDWHSLQHDSHYRVADEPNGLAIDWETAHGRNGLQVITALRRAASAYRRHTAWRAA